MKAKITFTFEYQLNSDNYPAEWPPEQCLAYDVEFCKDDPCEALATYDFIVKGELID